MMTYKEGARPPLDRKRARETKAVPSRKEMSRDGTSVYCNAKTGLRKWIYFRAGRLSLVAPHAGSERVHVHIERACWE